MRYFCEECDGLTDREMMLAAMATVEREYAVVGVLEMFNSSLTVFQNYIPGISVENKSKFYQNKNMKY